MTAPARRARHVGPARARRPSAQLDVVWIQSLHHLHCPTCDRRLVQRAQRCLVPEEGAVRYVGEVGTLTCEEGHALPGRSALYAYRTMRRQRA